MTKPANGHVDHLAREEERAQQMRELDRNWKSGVDDQLSDLKFEMKALSEKFDAMSKAVTELTDVLNMGKGSKAALILTSQLFAAIAVVWGGLYAIKRWILGL